MIKKIFLLCIGLVFAASGVFAAKSTFTDQQRQEIGKIAAEYIVNNPQVLIKASRNLQKQKSQEMQDRLVTAVLANKKALLDDKNTPMIKPKNAKVVVVEFFDYNCAYCHKVFPSFEKVMKNNPNVMYVFKEFPIFGQRWDSSKYGAEVGHAIYKLAGFKAYLKYHNAVFASGKMEGKLTKKDIDSFVQKAQVSLPKVQALAKKESANIDAGMARFISMGIQFTPVFVVMPLDAATKANTTLIPGFTTAAGLQKAINKAQGK